MKHKGIFLDKDGTLIYDVPYNVDPDKIKLYEGVGESLQKLKKHGYKLIVVTNQPGIAYDYFDIQMVQDVGKHLSEILLSYHVYLDGYYYCPHHPEGKVECYSISCGCRKPKPGMLLKGALDHNIDLSCSWMIGDILNDVEAGHRAGCKSILVDNGNETEWVVNSMRTPDFAVTNFTDVVDIILRDEISGGETKVSYEGTVKKSDRRV